MRAHAVAILALLVACGKDVETKYVTVPPEDSSHWLDVTAGSQWVEGIEIRLESHSEGRMIWVGELPFRIKAEPSDSLTAHFSVHVSNFTYNHPQCSCETDYGERCHEPYIVTQDTMWEVAK